MTRPARVPSSCPTGSCWTTVQPSSSVVLGLPSIVLEVLFVVLRILFVVLGLPTKRPGLGPIPLLLGV